MNSIDRDSDNDGLPDVIEAGGADNNGDGIIDGFADTDDDGISDNIDPVVGAITTGHANRCNRSMILILMEFQTQQFRQLTKMETEFITGTIWILTTMELPIWQKLVVQIAETMESQIL